MTRINKVLPVPTPRKSELLSNPTCLLISYVTSILNIPSIRFEELYIIRSTNIVIAYFYIR